MKKLLIKYTNFIVVCIFCQAMYSNDANCQNNGIRVLDLEYIYQVHPCCWCWAACITTIGNYYGNDNLELCDVVDYRRINGGLGANDCCNLQIPYTSNDSVTCIRGCPFYGVSDPIGRIFQQYLNINLTFYSGVLTYSQIKTEIDNNKPIKIIVGRLNQWGNPSYHSLVIIGYDDDGELIHYIDPGHGFFIDSYYDITHYYCMGGSDRLYGFPETCNYRFTTNPCPTSLNLIVNIGSNAEIKASNTIQCSSTISNNSNVKLIAGSSVTLTNGFEVQLGSVFFANTSSTPCL